MKHLAAILAIAGLAAGYAPVAAVGGEVDDFDREGAEKRAALARAERERREWTRRNARLQREIEETRRRHDDIRKLRAGIDPTNDGPLSRQQRRQLRRKGFKFDGEVRA